MIQGWKSVPYGLVSPLLVEAIKDQQGQIEEQRQQIQIQQTQWNSLSKQCVDRIVWPNDISGRNAMKFGPTMLDNIDVHVPLFNSAARGIFKISAWVKVSSDFTALGSKMIVGFL